MRHEMVGLGTVPVPLIRWGVNDVATSNVHDVTATRLNESGAFGDLQGLSVGMRVPSGPSTWSEVHKVDPNARRILALGDGINPDIAGEHCARAFARGLLGPYLHFLSLVLVR
jgi:hypothetical protein